MPRMYAFFLGIGVGAIVLFGASNYHIVRARDGMYCVPKQRAQLSQAYIDTRHFGPNNWAANPDLAAALTADNKQHVMEAESSGFIQNGLNRIAGRPQQPTY